MGFGNPLAYVFSLEKLARLPSDSLEKMAKGIGLQ